MDCFVAETMPVQYECLDIEKLFLADSFARINPENPDVLEKIRDAVGSNLWQRNPGAIRAAKNLVLQKCNSFAHLAGVLEKTLDLPLHP